MTWNPIEIEFIAATHYYARACKRWCDGDTDDSAGLLVARDQLLYRKMLMADMAFIRLMGRDFTIRWQPNDDDWNGGDE